MLNDPKVQEVANQIAKLSKTTENCWENAVEAYNWVKRNIRYVEKHEGYKVPSQTIEKGYGNCIEQAYLLASLIRALGCPRNNVKIVVAQPIIGPKHAWVEVYAKDSWNDLDTTPHLPGHWDMKRLYCLMDNTETEIPPTTTTTPSQTTTTTTILAETTTTTSISNVFLCCFGYSTLKYYWNETCEGGFQTTNCEYYAKISCNETCKSNGFLYGLEINNQCVCSSEYSHETTTSTPSTIPTTTMPQGVECELDEDCICGIYCGCISKQQFSMERCMAPCESDEIKCICVSGKCIEKSKIYQATSNITTTTLSCTSGCFYEGACLSFGTRIILNNIPSYCDTTKTFKTQKQDNELCQNNYECLSNWCSNGVCINIQKELETQKGILQMILDWLKGLYSFFTFRWLSETTTSTTATIVTTITTLPTTTSTVPTMAWCRSTNFIIYSCIYNSSDNKLVIILNNHGAEDVRDLMVYLSFLNGTTLLMTKLNETLASGEFRSYILSDIPSDFSKIIVSTQLCPDISKEDSCRRS
jgi:hypothetical protein